MITHCVLRLCQINDHNTICWLILANLSIVCITILFSLIWRMWWDVLHLNVLYLFNICLIVFSLYQFFTPVTCFSLSVHCRLGVIKFLYLNYFTEYRLSYIRRSIISVTMATIVMWRVNEGSQFQIYNW